MFKLQSKLQSMDVNNNIQKYKFHSGHKPYLYTKNRINKTFDSRTFNDSQKIQLKYNLSNRNNRNQIPPVYFYRKINTPYKYNMTSVPEYLIKTNEEKNFIDKLYQSLNNEKERTILNNLFNKKKLNSRKDNYKPEILELQNLLNYKPKFYSCRFNPESTSNNISIKKLKPLDIKAECNNAKTIENNNNKIINMTTTPPFDVKGLTIQEVESKKNLNDVNILNNSEISKKNQIKYKYQLSDVFNLRKEVVFLEKSAEKYLVKVYSKFRNNLSETCPNIGKVKEEENVFHTSSESKSDWIPNKLNNKKMGTYSSVGYNILSPIFQGSNRFITATELNKNNLYNESPAYHRVKSISEFIDLTRVSATNTLGCFDRNTNKRIPNFKFKSSVATNHADEYHINRDLIDRPI